MAIITNELIVREGEITTWVMAADDAEEELEHYAAALRTAEETGRDDTWEAYARLLEAPEATALIGLVRAVRYNQARATDGHVPVAEITEITDAGGHWAGIGNLLPALPMSASLLKTLAGPDKETLGRVVCQLTIPVWASETAPVLRGMRDQFPEQCEIQGNWQLPIDTITYVPDDPEEPKEYQVHHGYSDMVAFGDTAIEALQKNGFEAMVARFRVGA